MIEWLERKRRWAAKAADGAYAQKGPAGVDSSAVSVSKTEVGELAMASIPQVVDADVISSWASKINWANVVSAAAVIATLFGFDLTPEMQAKIVGGIGVATPVLTIILRTFFTTKLTAASVKG